MSNEDPIPISALEHLLVLSRFSRRQLRLEHFTTIHGTAWYLTDEGRMVVHKKLDETRTEIVRLRLLERYVPRALLPNIQATLLARHLRGDLDTYPPFVMDA